MPRRKCGFTTLTGKLHAAMSICRELERRKASAASARIKRRFTLSPALSSPTTIYRYDLAAGKSSVFRQPKVDFDSDQYETKQVFYKSKDGTRVPMFITAKKGLKLDGQNPVLLYAYGGFNISMTPAFSVGNAVWLEMGGVYAQPNLRGGGEYGEEWHQAGTCYENRTCLTTSSPPRSG